MSTLFLQYLKADLTLYGRVERDVPTFLIHHGCSNTAAHSEQVARQAKQVAERVGEDTELAEMAGWLHDCSAIFPSAERVEVARKLRVPVLLEEEAFPLIIHQKLSRVLAANIFDVQNEAVLSAVECHTTLKLNATRLDKVLFVADKIAWDQHGTPPYLQELLIALDRSLDAAAFVYIRYLWERRHTLKVIHPWLRDAYLQLVQQPGIQ